MRRLLYPCLALAFATGCPTPPPPGYVECDLTNETLNGTSWAYLEPLPDRTDRANPLARMQWYQEDGKQKLRYTVQAPFEIHVYNCDKRMKDGELYEWQCLEEEHLTDWCLALEAHERGSCTPEKLKDLGSTSPEDKMYEAMKEANKFAKEAKEASEKAEDPRLYMQWQFSKNNLANKLQGRLDAHVAQKSCQLLVTDNYMTIYNGSQRVDSNPVGTNPFVRLEDGDKYLWEKCNEGSHWYVDLRKAEVIWDKKTGAPDFPTNKAERLYEWGDEIYYHYVGDTAKEAEKGCTYTMDVWRNWLKAEDNVPVTPRDDKRLLWTYKYAWSADTDLPQTYNVQNLDKLGGPTYAPAPVIHSVRYKTCEGKPKEKIDIICSDSWLIPPADYQQPGYVEPE